MVRTTLLIAGLVGLLGCGETFEAGTPGGSGSGLTSSSGGAPHGGAAPGGAGLGGAGSGGATTSTSVPQGGQGGAPQLPVWVETKSAVGTVSAPPAAAVSCQADDLLFFSVVANAPNVSPVELTSGCQPWGYLESVPVGSMTASLFWCRSTGTGIETVRPALGGETSIDVFVALTVVRGAENPPAVDSALGGEAPTGPLWVDFDGMRPEGSLLLAFVALLGADLSAMDPAELESSTTEAFAVDGPLQFGVVTQRVEDSELDNDIVLNVNAVATFVAHGVVAY